MFFEHKDCFEYLMRLSDLPLQVGKSKDDFDDCDDQNNIEDASNDIIIKFDNYGHPETMMRMMRIVTTTMAIVFLFIIAMMVMILLC